MADLHLFRADGSHVCEEVAPRERRTFSVVVRNRGLHLVEEKDVRTQLAGGWILILALTNRQESTPEVYFF